jgi:hypothetical protein
MNSPRSSAFSSKELPMYMDKAGIKLEEAHKILLLDASVKVSFT